MIPASQPDPIFRQQGGAYSYISPSRLALWMKCPLAWKLRYLDGIRTPTSPALLVGKATHVGLEDLYRHRMLGIELEQEDLTRRVLGYWQEAVHEERVRFESSQQERKHRDQALNLVRAYLDQLPEGEPAVRAVEITMEAPLVDPETGEDLGIPLLGVADLILQEEAGASICDFKTSSRSAPPLEVTHELQLSCYAYLFRQLSGEQEAGLEIRSLIKTRAPQVQTQRYGARTDRHFRRLFAVLREYLEALNRGRFNYRPGWGCGMCDFRASHCRAWSPE